jgi:FixJ family two-component response regulator
MNLSNGLVYLLDDELGMVKALKRLLVVDGFEVQGFTSVSDFLQAYEPGTASCLVLDVLMPELDGIHLQQRLTHQGILIPIIFLTGHGDIPMSVKAMKAGAVDFLTKPVNDVDLLRAVRAALARAAEQHHTAAVALRLHRLTPREHEVMKHVIAGKLNKQIAADLGTGEQNIKIHRARVMQKMEMESVADLVRIAEKIGIGKNGN